MNKKSERCPGTFQCEKVEHAYIFLRNQGINYREAYGDYITKRIPLQDFLEESALLKRKYEHYLNEIKRLGGNVSKLLLKLEYLELRN
jgi:hypothetical protein